MGERAPQERFVERLKRVRAAAGGPSQADLLKADQAREHPGLTRSSLSDLLNGKFTRSPPWERVEAFATACVQTARDRGIHLPLVQVVQRLRLDHDILTEQLADPSTPMAEDRVPQDGPCEARPRRRFGAVPPRAGSFQQRAVARVLDDSVGGVDATVLAGAMATSAIALIGLGGVGKTQLAADYAHTQWEEGRVDLLMWISAGGRDAITSAYIDVAVELLGQNPTQPERAWRRLLEWFAETSTRWLIVIDDLQAPADLSGLWPPYSPNGRVVVTTRCRDAALQGDRRRIVDVELFTPDEALAYLAEKLPGRARRDTGIAELAGLADDLGYLPLALAQAAAYLINKPLLNCRDYRAKIADRRTTLEELLPAAKHLPDEHDRTVAATWALSTEAADRLEPVGAARPVLELVSLLDPAGVPMAVFTADVIVQYLASRLEREVATADVVGGLECLQRFSLITLEPGQAHRTVRVHALVQRVVRDTLPFGDFAALARSAADALQHAWGDFDVDQDLMLALRSNTAALQDIAGEYLWQPHPHSVLLLLARSLGNAGLLRSSISLAGELYHRALIQCGPDHRDTLSARRFCAVSSGMRGDAAGAVAALEELLVDSLRVLGPGDLDTLRTRSVLANWKGTSGDVVDAIAAFEQLVPDLEQVMGPDHRETLVARHNLAAKRETAGDVAGATTALEQLVPHLERVLRPNHRLTLASRQDLAILRGRAGDAAGAVAALEELVADYDRVLGPDHPDTLSSRADLAHWRGEAGDAADAVTRLQQLLADTRKVLGSDHLHTLTIRTALASWLRKAGDTAGAEAEFEQVFDDYVRVLGPEHPETLAAGENIAPSRGCASETNP
ncbi:FxSxx-COOH system tetratricopeptide repeat protein [Amycolatopsis sp. NPDC058278]|uniref:FxSxx-COOH system tetratricopeptide repeat protein n=1 Tax=Amycolatopsis sp. NPDC058278 TaxID=3346417 RepID=UPI0036DBF3FB